MLLQMIKAPVVLNLLFLKINIYPWTKPKKKKK